MYNVDVNFIRKEANGADISTRIRYREARKRKPNLPPDKIIAKHFGSFKEFVVCYGNKPIQKPVIRPKPKKKVSVKPDEFEEPEEPGLAVGHAENFTENEKKFIRIVSEYKEQHNIAFPSIVEFYRLARKFLGLKDEHADIPKLPLSERQPDALKLI